MRLLKFLWVWLRRIPARFSLPLLGLLVGYLILLSVLFQSIGVNELADPLSKLLVSLGIPPHVAEWNVIRVFLEALIVFLLFVVGILLSYNLAAVGYKFWRGKPMLPTIAVADAPTGQDQKLLGRFESIGLILAGGGAKGAYQAGAMRAIYEFLEENQALDKVRMIAGTSIGSWNAMFWLAGLIKPATAGGASIHEQWWRSISVGRIVEFDTYLPLRANHFLLTNPWKETFRQIFCAPNVRDRLTDLFVPLNGRKDPPIHFYLTRANVELGRLGFATNWPGISGSDVKHERSRDPNAVEMVKVRPDVYELIEASDLADALDRTERAVFASMDLPPLFPYTLVRGTRDEWFEDGGVVDNIPVWFGTSIEKCDLLFILPLNSSFAEEVNQTSVTKRLFRVMDVRQGVLERNSMKLTYLYNEIAALREEVRQSRGISSKDDLPKLTKPDLVTRALQRENKPISVFSICPARPLLIDTAEFWKPLEAGQAFDVMYTATRNELNTNFERDTNPNWLKMTLVDRFGQTSYVEDF